MFFMSSDIAKILEAAKPKLKHSPPAGAAVSGWTEQDTDELLKRVEAAARAVNAELTRPTRLVVLGLMQTEVKGESVSHILMGTMSDGADLPLQGSL